MQIQEQVLGKQESQKIYREPSFHNQGVLNVKKEHYVNKVLCGDVIKTLKKIPSNTFHLAITSPPYNVGKE